MNPLWVAGITGATAVLTALITSVIAYKMNKNTLKLERDKIKADVITKERMLWLKQLRENASKFFSEMDFNYNLLKRPVSVPIAEYQEDLDTLAKSIMKNSNDLLLCLNKEDDTQLALFNSINEIQLFILHCSSIKTLSAHPLDDVKYKKIKETFFKAMENIGNETWKQVKSFE